MSNPLQQALETLQPTDFSSVPIDNLDKFLKDAFEKAELIADSVPPYPGGEIYDHATLASGLGADSATTADEVTVSEARLPQPPSEFEELQKHWGKPVKVSDSSNPLKQTVWKMAGADRHGAWFARKSVHEGMGFERWKRAMKGEFAKSVEIQGGPGAGAVRGVGADARVENHEVEGVGRLEVWHLSAQFPKPVTSREFVTMLLTTDQGMQHQQGRYFVVVSIPVEHPQANARSELVRGNYESVEMIRELPIIKSKKSEDKDGKKSNKEAKETPGNDDEDPERNPVEWVMITRSDPGGGIPRFMVERNTPASITADAKKFVDWAAKGENIPSDERIEELKKEADIDEDAPAASTGGDGAAAAPTAKKDPQVLGTNESLTARYEPHDGASDPPASNGGILASLSSAAATLGSSMQAGYEAYMPATVQNNMPAALGGRTDRFADDTSSDSDSISSFESAQDYHASAAAHHQHAVAADQDPLTASKSDHLLTTPAQPSATLSAPNLPTERPLSPALSETSSISSTSRRKLSGHEKELQKIIAKRRSIAERHSQDQARDEQRQKEVSDRATKESDKQQQKLDKEKRKREERYAKEMAKIEERQRREEKKLERKRLKEENGETIVRLGREADDLRAENEVLRQQVAAVQREMTVLAREMGKMPGGAEVLSRVQAENEAAGRAQAAS